jgi:hypothetical protein
MRESSTSDIALFASVDNSGVCAEVTIELWLGEWSQRSLPVRVVRRKMAAFGAMPPRGRKAFHNAVLDEIYKDAFHFAIAIYRMVRCRASDRN